MGIPVRIGHDAANLGAAEVVVVSTAIKTDNPEVAEARARRVPVVRRAEMLAELMRLKWAIAIGGTHGKTTTTSMIAAVLDAAQYDPTVINGGIINAYGTNARLGQGDWIVVEADESDGTFVKLPLTVGVVTNIDPEHLDFYGSFEAVRRAFLSFLENVPFYGFAALCIDHPEVQALIPSLPDRRIVTYGHSPQADVRALRIRPGPTSSTFDAVISGPTAGRVRTITDLTLPMVGRHNVQNALAAIAIANEMGIKESGAAPRPGAVRRGEAPLHPRGRGGRHRGDRRLRPPPGRDRGRARRRALGDRASRHRRGAAASLFAPQEPVRGVLHRLQRCRRRDRRRRLRRRARRRSRA